MYQSIEKNNSECQTLCFQGSRRDRIGQFDYEMIDI
jgi:hypothetical protein